MNASTGRFANSVPEAFRQLYRAAVLVMESRLGSTARIIPQRGLRPPTAESVRKRTQNSTFRCIESMMPGDGNRAASSDTLGFRQIPQGSSFHRVCHAYDVVA